MNEFKYLKEAQCVRFDNGVCTAFHVFASEEDAKRWKRILCLSAESLCGFDYKDFLKFRGVAVIYTEGTEGTEGYCALLKLRSLKKVAKTWTTCRDLEEAEMRVLGRIAELRASEDFWWGS